MSAFKDTMSRVDEFNSTRLKLAADVADNSNLLKALVIKAEDARILGDMPAMRKFYRQLYDLNRCAGG
jgi:Bardet-Biedl syndrome 2 protein